MTAQASSPQLNSLSQILINQGIDVLIAHVLDHLSADDSTNGAFELRRATMQLCGLATAAEVQKQVPLVYLIQTIMNNFVGIYQYIFSRSDDAADGSTTQKSTSWNMLLGERLSDDEIRQHKKNEYTEKYMELTRRVAFLLELLHASFQQRAFFSRFMSADASTSASNEQYRWENVIYLLAVLPDKLDSVLLAAPSAFRSSLQSLGSNTTAAIHFFRHYSYYRYMTFHLVEYLMSSTTNAMEPAVCYKFLTSFLRRGYTDVCAEAMLESLDFVGDYHEVQKRYFYALMTLMEGISETNLAERLVRALLAKLDFANYAQREALVYAFAKLIKSQYSYRLIFTNKLLLYSSFEYLFAVMFIVDVLVQCQDRYLFLSILRGVCTTWKESHFVKHSTEAYHNYVTYLIVRMMTKISYTELYSAGLLYLCLEGVQLRLHSSIGSIRRTAALVAQKVSMIMTPEKPIVFDEHKGYLEDLEAQCVYPLAQQLVVDALVPSYSPAVEQTKAEETRSVPQKRRKEKTIREIDPDELYLAARDEDDEYDDEGEEDDTEEMEEQPPATSHAQDDESDVTSLVSFAMDEGDEFDELSPEYDVLRKPLQTPKYIRELIQLLRTTKDDKDVVEKLRLALNHTEKIVRYQTAEEDLQMISVELVKSLLFIHDSYNLDRFEELRMRSMIACCIRTPRPVGSFLASTFYAYNLNISYRMDALEVLQSSALELSNRSDFAPVQSEPEVSQQLYSSTKTYKPHYPENTRRWGSYPKAAKVTKANLFIAVAPVFFYGLLNGYDNPANTFNLFGEDTFVLSKLIHTIGTFVWCCGSDQIAHQLALSTLEFVWSLRYRQSSDSLVPSVSQSASKIFISVEEREYYYQSKGVTSVRRAVLYAMSQSLEALPSFLLMEYLGGVLNDYIEWLITVSRDDADELCRAQAIRTAQTLRKKLESVTPDAPSV